MVGEGQKDTYVGDKAVSTENVLEMRSPFERPPRRILMSRSSENIPLEYASVLLSRPLPTEGLGLSSSSESEDEDLSCFMFNKEEDPQWKSFTPAPLAAMDESDEPVVLQKQSFYEAPRMAESDTGRLSRQAESLSIEKEAKLVGLLRSNWGASQTRRSSSKE